MQTSIIIPPSGPPGLVPLPHPTSHKATAIAQYFIPNSLPAACAARYQRSTLARYMLRTRVVVGVAVALAATTARASTADVFGLGSEESAVAGASAARVHDFSAAHYDPAGLTLATRAEGTVGVIGFGASLPLPDGRTFRMTDRVGIL